MELNIGQIVISKAGRDKGYLFVVIALEGDFAYLADGKTRPLANPKKKKLKHIQPTKMASTKIAQGILDGDNLLDADFRAAIKIARPDMA